ncbi:hypothetical protein PCANC_27067 [Puccinia coronata f. sp. avenae]|uniref:Uncharacterized protein n=1 Tax=Puccinia coronata f. sp. avenae TaxID=200324 RepID=A0A2N5S160_9BASI|nr:hypothetical protein PCANC_27067 [Puccinia coronata f. sp. avenae]
MPTLISDQRGHYAFHPYQSMSQTSRGSSISCRVHRFCPITQALVSSRIKTSSRLEAPHQRRSVEKEPRNIASLDHGASATISNFTQAIRNEPLAASVVASSGPSLPNLWNTSQYPNPHSFTVSLPPATCVGHSARLHSPLPVCPHAAGPTQHSTVARGAYSSPASATSRSLASSSSSSSSKNVPALRDIVSYLKAWRPPVEYYARRRYQHPSLSYPSRRPSLPSLLEERVTNDGHMDVVCPQSAMSTSLRAYQKRVFPAHLSYTQPVSRHLSSQGWSDESEEDLASDGSDDDEESDDEDEAVTPTTSPASSTTYFLQPLVLTKLPDYS